MNPGGIRADLVENADGDVTYGAAFSVQPFNNLVVSHGPDRCRRSRRSSTSSGTAATRRTDRKILQVSGLSATPGTSRRPRSPDADAIVGDVLVDADGDPATAMVPLVDGDDLPGGGEQLHRRRR